MQFNNPQNDRHAIVMRIMAINSDQLCCESEINGIEIELQKAEEDAKKQDASPDLLEKIGALKSRAAALDAKKEQNRSELEQLDQTLAQINQQVDEL